MKHSLGRIPAGTRVFVDANIFALYYSDKGPLGQACRDFLERTTRLELQGFTSVTVTAETIHRVMVAEAAAKLNLSSRETVEYLQSHPKVVRQLTRHLAVPSDIHRMGIDILPVTYKHLHGSKRVRSSFGLMTNDSLIVAVMRANKLRHLVTHDAGFDRVTGIQLWGPAW